MDNNAQDKMEDEEISLLNILKMVKRHETRFIRQIIDMQGKNVSDHRNVLNTFTTHLRQKYEPIDIGISEWIIERLHALYEYATASVQINGTLTGSIPIQSAVR